MAPEFERFSRTFLGVGLLVLEASAQSLNSTCGDLITYNQYPDIIGDAPTCFKTGCGSSPLTSISSDCDPNSACFPIWTILNQKWQKENDWCSKCPKDRACRISGWPIFNATAACDFSPNTWLFGNGGCCINENEPASLAKWIETTCNESWRSKYTKFDGQAKRDWVEYLFAWNWTVRAENISERNVRPTCSAKPWYLGLFVIENVIFLLFTVFYAAATVWIVREKQRTQRLLIVRIILGILLPIKLLKKGGSDFFRFVFRRKSENGGGTGTVVGHILVAILFAGIQLASNFATAYIIKNTPGYEHIPAPLLALLFCCRPRLGWFACLLSLFPDSWLTKYFHLQPGTGPFVDGGLIINRVGVSASVGEIIMQGLGSYFLGKTAHVGVEKGFYLNHHLTPFYRGMQARNMYVGAMFWLVAAFGVVTAWSVFLVWHAALMHFYATTKSWLKHVAATAIPEKVQPKRMKSWRRSRAPSRRSSGRTSHPPAGDDYVCILRREPDQPEDERYNIRGGGASDINSEGVASGFQNFRREGGSSGITSGGTSSSEYDILPVRPQDFPQASTPVSSASRGTPVGSRGNGYEAVPFNPEMTQMRPSDFPQPLSPSYNGRETYREDNILIQSQHSSADGEHDPIYIQRVNRQPNSFPDTQYQPANTGEPDEGGNVETQASPYVIREHFPTTFKEFQPYIVGLAFFLGIISYVAQWLFWAGFVYAAGDRFCPPKLGFTGTVWSIAAILGISTNFLA
ncbi:hypothetical protein ONS95_008365 [Cadophora gregata]|uniref:uncharacterized protein n=1 Tax=Cadophora gregata TaxID=51156 RepID=UPI0026DC8E4D|nr:uncharacterized protein ONS95_008365 [Cadophora gregata]KAK0100417.1 hypothetical protein ONS96_007694 [Cadophora gregata f. sp. sojae]KAK0126785.1 hypothetical protein ONS95_008365 [Cadophora gregata]